MFDKILNKKKKKTRSILIIILTNDELWFQAFKVSEMFNLQNKMKNKRKKNRIRWGERAGG